MCVERLVLNSSQGFFGVIFGTLCEVVSVGMQMAKGADAMNEKKRVFFRVVAILEYRSNTTDVSAPDSGLGAVFLCYDTPAKLQDDDFFFLHSMEYDTTLQ